MGGFLLDYVAEMLSASRVAVQDTAELHCSSREKFGFVELLNVLNDDVVSSKTLKSSITCNFNARVLSEFK